MGGLHRDMGGFTLQEVSIGTMGGCTAQGGSIGMWGAAQHMRGCPSLGVHKDWGLPGDRRDMQGVHRAWGLQRAGICKGFSVHRGLWMLKSEGQGAARHHDLFAWDGGDFEGMGPGLVWGRGKSQGDGAGTVPGWSGGGGVFARRWGGCMGLALWLLCFPLGRPKSQGCNSSSHTRNHKPHRHSPQQSPCLSLAGLVVPPTLLGLGGLPGMAAWCWRHRNASGALPLQQCWAGSQAFTALPAHAGSPACPSCVPHARWGGNIKIPPPPPVLLLCCRFLVRRVTQALLISLC